jgi:hypothetical protein
MAPAAAKAWMYRWLIAHEGGKSAGIPPKL